jgi:hypothetical protein
VLFNQILFNQIQALIKVPEFTPAAAGLTKILGNFGNMIHQPLYQILRGFVRKKTKNTVFYDSVLFGLLFFCYPVYLILIGLLLSLLPIPFIILLLILLAHPLLAYFATSSKIHTRS